MTALYQLNNICHDYGTSPVLTIDRWETQVGAITGVVGPNGSGKSTFLCLLGFIMTPSRGEIQFRGRPAGPFAQVVRGKVALLPQDAYLLKRSVFQNVAYGLKALKSEATVETRVNDALQMVGLDGAMYARRPWFALSGGEARRVALAARLALRPEVLIMDEPTASVDAASAQMIKDAALHAHRQWGSTLVLASHDTDWLEDICTDTLHLFRGRPMGSGRRTLIFGPWQRQNTSALRMLTDDQYFLAANPPEDLQQAAAAIEAQHLTVNPPSDPVPSGCHSLKGLLLRLSFEQSTGQRWASVLIGSTALTIYLGVASSGPPLQPGHPVQVIYDPCDVSWY